MSSTEVMFLAKLENELSYFEAKHWHVRGIYTPKVQVWSQGSLLE